MTRILSARPDLGRLPAYIPGKRVDHTGSGRTARLASNESPYAPLASVQELLQSELSQLNRYPDMRCEGLIGDLAAHLAIDSNRIAVGNGSSSLIRDVVTTVAGPGDEVLHAMPSFPYYANAAIIAGAASVGVALDGAFRHDLDALADAVTERTRVVFVCNPNNPTGTIVSRSEIAAFLDRVPRDVLVIIDEAYIEFAGETADALPLIRQYENVGVLRTFSKAYGLAGLRVGYLIAPEALVSFVRRVSVPFTVNSLAQSAARASLTRAAQAELATRVSELVVRRDELLRDLLELGLPAVESGANFIFLPLGARSQELVELCERRGVLVRASGNGVRVSVGDEMENAQLLAALRGL